MEQDVSTHVPAGSRPWSTSACEEKKKLTLASVIMMHTMVIDKVWDLLVVFSKWVYLQHVMIIEWCCKDVHSNYLKH